MRLHQLSRGSGMRSLFLELYKDYSHQERLPSPLWVFIMVQRCKITGFPQCFLLFVRLCHGNLEPVHVRDSGLSCKAPLSGIHDVSGSCAKAFLRLVSDSSTQELHCGDEETTVRDRRGEENHFWTLIIPHVRTFVSLLKSLTKNK